MTKHFWLSVLCLAVLACHKSQDSSSAGVQSPVASVIGGTEFSEPYQRPATVGIAMSNGGTCTGSYIGNNTVLTASHCIYETKARKVKFNHPDGVFSCSVDRQIAHPDYELTQADWFDIAVLKINCSDSRINDILPYILNTESKYPSITFSAGYGLDEEYGGFRFPKLSFLQLEPFDMNTILKDQKISDELKKADGLYELVEMVHQGRIHCYKSTPDQTMYSGDSGGPHYAYAADGMYILLGVNDVLFQLDDDLSSAYAFCSTSVAFYKDWIEAQSSETF